MDTAMINKHDNALLTKDQILGQLRTRLQSILDVFDRSARIVYYDYPLHLNVGDLLINLGTEEFFAQNQLNIWRRQSAFDMPATLRDMDENVVVLCHGGGNFGDIYSNYLEGRNRLLRQYSRNRIVVLPQTVHFKSPERLRESVQAFETHGNYHVFVRDQRSLSVLTEAGMRHVSALPDMAHSLWGVLTPDQSVKVESEPMRFARTDSEAEQSGAKLIGGSGSTVDWQNILSPTTKLMAKVVLKGISAQNRLGSHSQKAWQWYPVRDRAIREGVRYFSRYKTVYTNRLHSMILGILLNREVHPFDNSYGKLSTYADAWLGGSQFFEVHRPE